MQNVIQQPIMSLLTTFLSEKDVRKNSRDNYRRTLQLFINWMVVSGVDVRSPKRADIINYKAYLLDAKHPPTTVDSYLTSVRQFFTWMEESGIYSNVTAGVKSPWKHRGFVKGHLKKHEVKKLVSIIPDNTLIGLRDRAFVCLMVTMGLRAIEVCRIEREDMLRNSAGVKLQIQSKRHFTKDRTIGMIPDWVVVMIDDYLDNREDDASYLFATHQIGHEVGVMSGTSLSRIVRQYLIKAELKRKDISCHSLRHTAAVTALENGATIEDVQALLGHKDISTTMIYLSSIQAEKAQDSTAVRCAAAAYEIDA